MTQFTGVLKEIADVAGEAAAVALAASVGGTRIYIPAPRRLNEKHWLVVCVGRRAALKIAEHFSSASSGQRIDIPLCGGGAYPQLRRAIAKRVHEMNQAGASASEITQAVGITTRAVHRHRRAHRTHNQNQRQGKLL